MFTIKNDLNRELIVNKSRFITYNLEFIKYEDGIVYVKLFGACQDCPMLDVTLKDGIEELIINEIPEVKEVRNID